MFFNFDGIDGAGKSTQMGLFCDWLRQMGHNVVACRDPGSTPLGETIRRLLLENSDVPISRRAEMLLYMAARAQLVDQVIAPALAAGKIVVSDRFLLSNVVYQGHAGGLGADYVWELGRAATGGVQPEISFVLDLSPEAAARRMERPLDRMEREGLEFHRALRAGFLAEADRDPVRIVVIDSDRPIDAIQTDLRDAACRVLR
jgi:dTMP kinase